MGDENHICTLGDYYKPSHKGYRNTIELPVGNNVDTIRLVQNGCSFHGLRSEDPNQHLKDYLKLVDSLDLDGENRERMRLRLFQFSLHDQASNWLERLPAGSITTWEDLTTRFLAQFFPPGRIAKLPNDILMFQQHHGESLSEAWTRFKDLLQKVPHYGIDLWLKLRDRNAEESWTLLEDPALYDNESWNDPRDFAKPVKAIALPQDVSMNKITTSCEICSGPHNTHYCMEDLKQAFVEYASSRTDEARVLCARSYLSEDPQCSTQTHGSIKTITIPTEQQSASYNNEEKENKKEEDNPENIHVDPPTPFDPSVTFITEKFLKFNSFFESLGLVSPLSNTELICTKEEDGDVMFIEIILKDDDSRKEEPKAEGQKVEYFDIFPTRSELAYHKYLMCGPIPSVMRQKLDPRENSNGGISNFTRRIKGMHVFVGNFTYIVDFMIVEDIGSIIDPRLSQVQQQKFAYKIPHNIEQYDSLSDLEKEQTKLVYLRNEKDKRRGVEYVMNKILGLYKECLELGPEYLRGMDDEGEVT
ncbi:MAK10-like protein [Tanacetum coccineum]|uniref:MAK10-like protein n=1 Tax=Tanacetum coccineum TaxID=301880 RepID=A0ABQ4ZUJ4_9ASTR